MGAAKRALWTIMDARPRLSMAILLKSDIPMSPGVYALYRRNERIYVGMAGALNERIWNNHSGRGVSMTNSALRRNIAEHLGIASSADIKARRYRPSIEDAKAVRTWLDSCAIAWIECDTKCAADQLEDDLKSEYMPQFTKR